MYAVYMSILITVSVLVFNSCTILVKKNKY